MTPSRTPRAYPCLKAAAPSWAQAHEGGASGGVFDVGMYEEDDPVTWEALAAPERVGRRQGRTVAETDGGRESEGRIRATKSGNE
jgi:hypothetical protein